MWTTIVPLVGGVLLALVVIGVVFVVGMRTGTPLVVDAVRRFNRAVWNPRSMRTAGTPGAFAVVRHVGRTTGRPYETPVGAVATEDGFVIALPYGLRADWVQNVLASGSATILAEGDTVRVDRPEVVPTAEVASRFAPGDRRSFRWLGVDRCLRVRRVEPDETASVETPS